MQRYKAYANYDYSGDDPHVCKIYRKSLLQKGHITKHTIVHKKRVNVKIAEIINK